MDKMNTQEMVSALADGQLQGDALQAALDAVAGDEAARRTWHMYHLVGDVIRSEDLAHASDSAQFLARLQDSLKFESVQPGLAPIEYFASQPAANDGWRWKLVAGLATVTAVAAISWSLVGGMAADKAAPQLAASPAPGVVLAGSRNGPMIRDEQLDRLLAAHRQFGGATALQTPAPFVRNASFETPAR